MAKKTLMLFVLSIWLISCSKETSIPIEAVSPVPPTVTPLSIETPIPTPDISGIKRGGDFFEETYSIVKVIPSWEFIEEGEVFSYGIAIDKKSEYLIISRIEEYLDVENGETGEHRAVEPVPGLFFSIPIMFGSVQDPKISGIIFVYIDESGEFWIEDSLSIMTNKQINLLNKFYGSGDDI